MLIVLLIAIAVIIGSWLIGQWQDWDSFIPVIAMVLAAIVASFAIMAFVFNFMDVKELATRYESTKITIEDARKDNVDDIERAALITKIIEINEKIASYKYWNTTIFDDTIPDEVMSLEPLK